MPSSKSPPSTGWREKSTFSTVQQFILPLKADSKATVIKFLEEVKERCINEHRKRVLCTADQKLYEIFQVLKNEMPTRCEEVSCFLEMFHVTWNIDKMIYTSYSELGLRELFAAIGYMVEEHYSYVSQCRNVHRSHYLLTELSLAVRAELLSAFLDANPSIKADFQKATGDMPKITKFVECNHSSFQEWQAQMANTNPMLQMWLQFIDVVTCSEASWDAQRTGDHNL